MDNPSRSDLRTITDVVFWVRGIGRGVDGLHREHFVESTHGSVSTVHTALFSVQERNAHTHRDTHTHTTPTNTQHTTSHIATVIEKKDKDEKSERDMCEERERRAVKRERAREQERVQKS